MIGILLGFIGTFFLEVSSSIGKRRMEMRTLSLFSVGFLSGIWVFLIFLGKVAITPSAFVFSAASLPTFSIRVIFEIIQAQITLMTIAQADRSTYGFLRSLTLPFLLIVDLMLGYHLSTAQFAGIALVVFSVIFLEMEGGMSKSGRVVGVIMALNGVLTTSLYKYDITHFNSVEAEQLIVTGIVISYLFVMALWKAKENPLAFMFKKKYFFISIGSGIGGVLMSHAYMFAPASVIMAVKRAGEVLWSTIIGIRYFGEQQSGSKLSALCSSFSPRRY